MSEGKKSAEKEPDEQERRPRRWRFRLDGISAQWPLSGGLTLAGTGVIAAMIVVVTYFVLHDDPPSQVEVPELVGLQRADAEAELSERGLKLRAAYDQASGQPPGTVLRTDPAAGTKLSRGHGVSLVLASAAPGPGSTETNVHHSGEGPLGSGSSEGPSGSNTGGGSTANVGDGGRGGTEPRKPNSRVPAVTGLTVDAATGKLRDGDLAVGSIIEEESDRPADTIVRSNPPAGATVRAGTPVDLVVAKAAPVFLGVGRTDPDDEFPDCATGYRTIFSQQISVTEPITVTYQWLRSDGAGAPVEYVDFTAPGTQLVTTTWQRWGEPGEKLTGWQQLKVLTPKVLTGQKLEFSHGCPGGAG